MMVRFAFAVVLAVAVEGCRTAIESGLSEEEANRVLVALDRHGIHAVKEAEAGGGEEAKYAIRVASDDVATALAVLRAENLPDRPEPGLREIFGQPSLVPTATEERARLSAALSGELARSIEAIEGVLDARVHVALPERDSALLDAPPPRPRASVLVRYRGTRPPYDEMAVRMLVAGAVQDLDPADVAVVGVAAPEPPTSASQLTSFGPIAVTRSSVPALRLVLATSLGFNVLLVVGVVWLVVRHRRAARSAELEEDTTKR
jgi:type III secretion protein J